MTTENLVVTTSSSTFGQKASAFTKDTIKVTASLGAIALVGYGVHKAIDKFTDGEAKRQAKFDQDVAEAMARNASATAAK